MQLKCMENGAIMRPPRTIHAEAAATYYGRK